MMGCLLKDAISRRMSGVKAPPAADAPEDIHESQMNNIPTTTELVGQEMKQGH
jgi:hypothetical protein